MIYTKVNEVFRNIDGHYYKCVEGIGCRNCAFRGTGSCGQYVCAEATRPDRVPVKFVAVSDEPIEPKKEKEMEKDTATEEPSRHIELGVVKVEGDNVTFKIIEQTHKRKEFCQQIDRNIFTASSNIFKASNEIKLGSEDIPEWIGNSSLLFCRGFFSDKDNIEIVCTTSEFARISEAINEYNTTNGKGYEKPWPQKGDKYFYITAGGDVSHCTFNGYNFDLDTQSFGNVFRTEQEALAARNKIEILLKELNSVEGTGANEL